MPFKVDDYSYTVEWREGNGNIYRESDLVLAEEI